MLNPMVEAQALGKSGRGKGAWSRGEEGCKGDTHVLRHEHHDLQCTAAALYRVQGQGRMSGSCVRIGRGLLSDVLVLLHNAHG